MAAGEQLAGRYVLGRRIAVGGMGEVWEASDERLGRSVAVKVLRAELSDDPEFLHRFRAEARTVAALDHPGIAAVHDYGEDGDDGSRIAYLVMELVRGEPLSARIGRGPLGVEDTLDVLEQSAHALQAAHERGVVHRDVKPGNILLRTDGRVKLTDFGIAKAADAVPVTRSGMVMGTAHYIAPEQASGEDAGPAGDVYSLGVVGYECLAGHRPFRADSAITVALMQVRDAPPPLPETLPAAVRELVDAVLVKDPARRYATGGEFAAAVAALRRGEPVPLPAGASGSTAVEPRPATGTTGAGTTASGGARPAAPSTGWPAAAERGATDGVRTGSDPARRARARPPAASSPGTAPLRIAPARGLGHTLLLIVFLLLTAAALLLGWYVVRGLEGDTTEALGGPAGDTRAGTVLSREDAGARSTVPGRSFGPVLVTGGVR
ncbi:MAG TPA: serine/threonine-protein kinase [Pseudonocardia sp.]|nr:serine/threonine-protein kinase [Pseudonocardia sp.]